MATFIRLDSWQTLAIIAAILFAASLVSFPDATVGTIQNLMQGVGNLIQGVTA